MGGFLGLLFAIMTAMVGNTIHGSLFWSIMDLFFAPFAWCKWLIYHEVTLAIIKQTFSFFF
jgi:hypothetical protein